MAVVRPSRGQTVIHTHVNQYADILGGVADAGEDIRLTQRTNADDYANVLGNVDATNGYALKVQYGPADSPTTIATFAKAGVTFEVPVSFGASTGGAELGWFSIADEGALPGAGNAAATTTAITATLTKIVAAGGGVMYIPPSTTGYFDNLNRSVGAIPFALRGAGPGVSKLYSTLTTGSYLTVTGSPFVVVTDLALAPSGVKPSTTYLISLSACAGVWIDRSYIVTSLGGGCVELASCTNVQIDKCWIASFDGNTGDTCVRVKASVFTISNCLMQTGATEVGRSPTVWITGTLNSSKATNCIFAGGGPVSSIGMSSIVDLGAAFAVGCPVAHGLAADDIVVLRGTGVAAYDGQWRVASVSTDFVFTVTGTTGGGPVNTPVANAVQTVAATFYLDSDLGAYNESVVSNCLFTRTANPLYGTASVYADGRRGDFELNGWEFNGCWYDYGMTAVIVSGKNVGGVCNVYGFRFSGGYVTSPTRAVHIDQACGIMVKDMSMFSTSFAAADDTFGESCGVLVYSPSGAPFCTGISISGNHIGIPRDFAAGGAGFIPKHGILLDGRIDDLLITSNQIAGSEAPITSQNSAVADTRVWKIRDNICTDDLPMDSATTIPTLASGNSIAATLGFDTFNVSGTTDIQEITNGYAGREVTLLFAGALDLITGGNLAIGASRTILSGDAVTLWFNGASWYAR